MKHTLLAVFFLSFLPTFAQFYDFDISNYRLPEMKRQSLDFNFNGNGEHRIWKTLSHESLNEESWDKLTTSMYRSDADYTLYLNSPKTQTTLYLNVGGNLFRVSENEKYLDNAVSREKVRDLSTSVNLLFNKKQFNKQNWFLMAESNSWISYNHRKNVTLNSKEKTPSANISMGVGGGKGRIEQVQDFRQAILMLNEMEKRGVLNRGVTEQEMHELASLLSELKNERFFDSRLRKEADLTAIDSLLTKKGLVDEKNISYYYGMEDMWTYGDLQIRESGNQLSVLITPAYFIQNISFDSINQRTEKISLLYKLEYNSRKPLSLKWQRNYKIGMDHLYKNVLESPQYHELQKLTQTSVYMEGELGFYPNTRTYLRGYLKPYYRTNRFTEIKEDNNNYYGAYANLGCYYYISQRVRLNLSAMLNHQRVAFPNENDSDTSDTRIYYTATFSYALF